MRLALTILICGVLCGCQAVTPSPPAPLPVGRSEGGVGVALAVKPPAPVPVEQMLAYSVGAPAVTITLTQTFTLPVGWDSYLTPASALAVQGADRLCGPWTNEALYAPPSLTNRFTASYTNRLHFLRLAIIP